MPALSQGSTAAQTTEEPLLCTPATQQNKKPFSLLMSQQLHRCVFITQLPQAWLLDLRQLRKKVVGVHRSRHAQASKRSSQSLYLDMLASRIAASP